MWMGATHFLTKRFKNVSTEMSLHVLAYNLKRMMPIMGTQRLISAIEGNTFLYFPKNHYNGSFEVQQGSLKYINVANRNMFTTSTKCPRRPLRPIKWPKLRVLSCFHTVWVEN
jgi:hypothetical protein